MKELYGMMKELTVCLGFSIPCLQDASEKKVPKEGIYLLVGCTKLPLFLWCVMDEA